MQQIYLLLNVGKPFIKKTRINNCSNVILFFAHVTIFIDMTTSLRFPLGLKFILFSVISYDKLIPALFLT